MLRSAQIAGALQGMLEMTITYANERIQFGKAIGSFQAIQHQIAVLSEHTAASVMGAEAAFAESAETLGRLPVTAAKVCASEAAGIGASVAHGCTVPLDLPTNTRCTWARAGYGAGAASSEPLPTGRANLAGPCARAARRPLGKPRRRPA
jgi:acyl-CoA dehydrogenase